MLLEVVTFIILHGYVWFVAWPDIQSFFRLSLIEVELLRENKDGILQKTKRPFSESVLVEEEISYGACLEVVKNRASYQ